MCARTAGPVPVRVAQAFPIPGGKATAVNPISTCAFSHNGSYFAYAVSYDWSLGMDKADKRVQNSLVLQVVNQEDIKPKPAAAGAARR